MGGRAFLCLSVSHAGVVEKGKYPHLRYADRFYHWVCSVMLRIGFPKRYSMQWIAAFPHTQVQWDAVNIVSCSITERYSVVRELLSC